MLKRPVVFVVCILMSASLLGCSYLNTALGTEPVLDAAAAASVGFTLESTSITITDAGILTDFADIINRGRSVQVDTLDIPSPDLTVTVEDTDGATQVFGIYDFTRDGPYAYVLTPDNGYCEVDRQTLFALLSGVSFEPLYVQRQFPNASITADEKQGVLAATDGDWSYKRLDGRYYESAVATADEDYKYVLTSPNAPVITFTSEPDVTSVTVTRDDTTVFSGTLEELLAFRMSGGGRYEYEITAVWSEAALSSCYGNALYRFCVDYAPKAGFEISTTSSDPGETIVIYATGLADEEITVTSPFNFEARFFDYDGMRVCLFPLSYHNDIGSYTLELSAEGAYAKYEITLNDKKFEIQNLTVDDDVTDNTIDNSGANAEFDRIIQPLKAVRDDTKYFEGEFIRPASGEITTEFGAIRTVNNSADSTRHSGIDIAAKRGTNVKASGAGRILYAGSLQLTGNTVLIEHGFGLKTWYYHMDSLKVKTDDMVEQGDVIGTVGSTGFSTGPHLHFGMSVGGVFINPDTAINGVLLK
ncbi:MAG: M23 family metallopeptidase [Acetanaerobacterium sp.]